MPDFFKCPSCGHLNPTGPSNCQRCSASLRHGERVYLTDAEVAAATPTKRTCPFCAEEIQAAAIVCKHCGRDVPPVPKAVPVLPPVTDDVKSKTSASLGSIIVWVGFGAFAFLALLGWLFAPKVDPVAPPKAAATAGQTPRPTPEFEPEPTYDLELLSSRGYGQSAFKHIEGEVRNISGRKLDRVTAVGTWYTTDDTMVTSDSALIEFDPLLPGQTSPFETLSRANPEMKKYSVTFKRLLGGTLSVKDSRKK